MINWNAGVATNNAPPITNIKEGSNVPENTPKKPDILLDFVIPVAPNARAKRKPATKSVNLFNQIALGFSTIEHSTLLSRLIRAPAAREAPPSKAMEAASVTLLNCKSSAAGATRGTSPGARPKIVAVFKSVVVRAPKAMNVSVLAKDRAENLALPQIPWPDVQPLPSAVPNPTSNPATIMRAGVIEEGNASNTEGQLVCRNSPPRIKPLKNNKFQGVLSPPMSPLIIPEIPNILPETTSFVIARTPREMPPKSAGKTGWTIAGVITTDNATVLVLQLRFFL